MTARTPSGGRLAARLPRPADGELLPCVQIEDPSIFDLTIDGESPVAAQRRWRIAEWACSHCPLTARQCCIQAAVENHLSGVFAGRLLVNGRCTKELAPGVHSEAP